MDVLKNILFIFLWHLIIVDGVNHNKVFVLKGNVELETIFKELKTFGLSFVEQVIILYSSKYT